ncbi:hypothetical protein CHS0354_031206 [Potamilus streckersoni]|uniref:F5/8 type C domain-containing protein n=1 Tax=Potamilus streckersoni TaxID=2493646 RepID=A0AAE0WEB5_9BIVA|nr:hypothetical protein CHS0354_031206 [Potamilus streckersoni]
MSSYKFLSESKKVIKSKLYSSCPFLPSSSASTTISTLSTTIPTTTTPMSTGSPPTSTSTRSIATSTAPTQASITSITITSNSSHFNLVPFGINGPRVCHEYLVSGSRGVADSQLSASSVFGPGHEARRGRLHVHVEHHPNGFKLMGGWSALSTDPNPWIQASLAADMELYDYYGPSISLVTAFMFIYILHQVRFNWLSLVQGVITQGRHVDTQTRCCDQWITRYKAEYSLDGVTWQSVRNHSNDVVNIGLLPKY